MKYLRKYLAVAAIGGFSGGDCPPELESRGTVIVRVPFDDQGQAQSQQAEIRVLESASQIEIVDVVSAEQAWNQAQVPEGLRAVEVGQEWDQQMGKQSDQQMGKQSEQPQMAPQALMESLQPPRSGGPGSYGWNPGYPPSYNRGGYAWGYGNPGFYFGWGGRNGFSFGYGPGPGYAGGYNGWYGPPLGPGYNQPYPGWYRPGYGYYHYPRGGGNWTRR